MPPMNTAQARAVDPILTNHARGYVQPNFVGNALFPRISVPKRGFKVIKFGTEGFMLYNTARAPGADRKRVTFGYGTEAVTLKQDSLEAVVPFEYLEETSDLPSVDLASQAVNVPLRSIALGLEYRQAAVAQDANNYGASNKIAIAAAGDKWSADTSTPGSDVNTAKQAVADQIAMEPNTMVIGQKAYYALKENAALKNHFKYTSGDAITLDMLARYFEVDRLEVGRARYWDADAGKMMPVWGNHAILSYTPPEAERAAAMPAYGYTYGLQGYPNVRVPYDEDRNDSWFYPTTDETSVELVGATAGYLIQNVVD